MRVVLVVVLLAGCGRQGFDENSDGPSNEGPSIDGSAIDAAVAASCVALPATCGSDGQQSCCESPVVTGGTFDRGYDVGTDMAYPDMTHPATLSTFRLDKYEVTVGRFRRFVAAGMGTQANPPPAGAGARTLNGIANQGGWDPTWNASLAADTGGLAAAAKCNTGYGTWTDTAGANENRPINCITWYEAMAFCTWDGGYLSTEAESGYAAAGGSLQRAYPWSNPPSGIAIDCTVANYGGASWPSTACIGAGANIVGSLSPQSDGLWGQTDLAGNVWEWLLDGYGTPVPTPCNDCANLFASSVRVIRGGSFLDPPTNLRAAYRYNSNPSARNPNVGVRCARAP